MHTWTSTMGQSCTRSIDVARLVKLEKLWCGTQLPVERQRVRQGLLEDSGLDIPPWRILADTPPML